MLNLAMVFCLVLNCFDCSICVNSTVTDVVVWKLIIWNIPTSFPIGHNACRGSAFQERLDLRERLKLIRTRMHLSAL